MKKFVGWLVIKGVLLALMLLLFFVESARAEVDHWSTPKECEDAESGPTYYPTLIHEQPLGSDEVTGGLPSPSCVDMNLPDRMGGRGWVRIGEDRKIIFDKNTGKPLRLAECNNTIFNVVALPAGVVVHGKDGEQGPKGDPGPAGRDGRDGYTPIKNVDYRDGRDSVVPGPKGDKGEDASFSWGKTTLVVVGTALVLCTAAAIFTHHFCGIGAGGAAAGSAAGATTAAGAGPGAITSVFW